MSRVLMFATLPAGGIVSLADREHQGGNATPQTKHLRFKSSKGPCSENSPERLIFDSAAHKFGG
jgi:hypothetical protein